MNKYWFSNKMRKPILSIRMRLLMIYFILIVIPLGGFTYIAYARVSAVVFNQTLKSASQSFGECVTNLERYLTDMNTIMINLLQSREVYEVAAQDSNDYYIHKQKIENMLNFMRYLRNTTGVSNISLSSQSYYSTDNLYPYYTLSDLHELNWYKMLSDSEIRRLWFSPILTDKTIVNEDTVISYASRIYRPEQLKTELAVIKIDLSKEKVLTILQNTAFTPNSMTYIYDGQEIIISNNLDIDMLNLNPINETLSLNTENIWTKVTIHDSKVVFKAKKNLLTGWYFVTVVPLKDMNALGNRLSYEMLIVTSLIAIISYIMAYFISDSSVKRLSLLTKQMKKFENGNSFVKIQDTSNDEISLLINGFNSMVSNVSNLIEDKYQMGLEVKSLELKALQSQINPHFLYNSLDMINCLSIKYNIKEIGQMVNALSKFYKLSLSSGNDFISIEDEIAHVTLYINIQNLRFENKINLVTDIDPEIYNYRTIKIIMQPIVENAIIHGIFNKESKTGTITIKGRLQEDRIIINVIDDGIGMSEEVVSKLLNHKQSGDKHGYGNYNTHSRIVLAYGSAYGLSYQSKIGEGTNVTIQLPIIK